MPRIGFLGLGIMGRAMAANLVRAGHQVTVWNRTAAKCAPLEELGATRAATPREVAQRCDVTLAMLADPEAAEAVCFGPDGVLEGIGEGRGYVDMSTVDPDTPRKIGAAVAARHGRFLEAPVSGSKKPAEDGTLVVLAAGDRSLFEEVEALFAVLGKQTFYLGEIGQGAGMKLVVNMVMGGMMEALCEGMALGEKADLDPQTLLEVLGCGALANPMFRLKGPLMVAGEYAANFPLKHMQKDLRLALGLGDALGQPLHGAATVNEAFKRARQQGLADQDFSALYRAVKE